MPNRNPFSLGSAAQPQEGQTARAAAGRAEPWLRPGVREPGRQARAAEREEEDALHRRLLWQMGCTELCLLGQNTARRWFRCRREDRVSPGSPPGPGARGGLVPHRLQCRQRPPQGWGRNGWDCLAPGDSEELEVFQAREK